MMIISGIWGPGVWSAPFVDGLPFLGPFVGETTSLADIWFPFVFGAFMVGHLPACVIHVYEARSSRNEPVLPVFLEWTPMIAFTTATTMWLCSPHSWILADNHLTLFCLTMSLVFGRMTTKIILAHLTRQPFPYWTVLITPLVGGAVLTNLPLLGFAPILTASTELYYLYAYLAVSFVVYSRWAHLVITSICDFLGINALTIPKDKWKALVQQSNGGPLITGQMSPPKKD
jgi:ethanolaminephosphotransferase